MINTKINKGNYHTKLLSINDNYIAYKHKSPNNIMMFVNDIRKLITVKKQLMVFTKTPNYIEKRVKDILHNLGFPSHLIGYQYLIAAICMIYFNEFPNKGITTIIYPKLATMFSTNASSVERAIRHAIEISWCRGSIKLIHEIFGYSIHIDKGKPTNSEFIITIVERLRSEIVKR